MRTNRWLALSLSMLCAAVLTAASLAAATVTNETEPNNSPATANGIIFYTANQGSIDPLGDVDYYLLPGVNTTWGYIALLDTLSSTAGTDGVLTALRSDGVTVLESASGNWERGSGIDLQPFVDSSADLFLKVNEHGDNAAITPYRLHYYETIVASQPEVEPNGTPASSTPSSFSMQGVIQPAGDVDCYGFHGRAGDILTLALDGDPEDDGSPTDLVLELRTSDGGLVKSADHSLAGGSEFILSQPLETEGAFAYCVRSVGAGGGAGSTYLVGIVRNSRLYFPEYWLGPTWLNPRPGEYALPGDTLTYRLWISNTSPVNLPGLIHFSATYPVSQTTFLNSQPAPTSQTPGELRWDNLLEGLAPGQVYSITLNLRADSPVQSTLYQSTGVRYYFTGHGTTAPLAIYDRFYLPVMYR
jgi:hypothetical protein